jgi:hypothetical protein
MVQQYEDSLIKWANMQCDPNNTESQNMCGEGVTYWGDPNNLCVSDTGTSCTLNSVD